MTTKMEKIMCQCCGENPAEVKDCRTRKDGWVQHWVCYACIHRSNASFWAKMGWTERKIVQNR